MTNSPAFPKDELDRRLTRARQALADSNLDGILITVPESIYYLTGLDHWGFFATHVLVLNRNGDMALCCRAMERITFENQVANARFYGHRDHEELADHVHAAMRDLGLAGSRVGIEKRSLFLHLHHGERIMAAVAGSWVDASGLIDDLRLVKSPLEMDYTRKAARAADRGTLACIRALHDGATDYEIAAEYMRVSILEGSEYPGFGPFIRPTTRLGEEHTTWRGETFRKGDAVFLETCAAYRKYQGPMGRLVYVGSAAGRREKVGRDREGGDGRHLRGAAARCQSGRCLRRLARCRRHRGPCGLSPPPLRLPCGHRVSAQLDRRFDGHEPLSELRADHGGRHGHPRSFLVHQHQHSRLLHLEHRFGDRKWR